MAVATELQKITAALEKMSEEEQALYSKESVLIANRTELLLAINDGSPVKLQLWISNMSSIVEQKEQRAQKQATFLPGAPIKEFQDILTLKQLTDDVNDWSPDTKEDLAQLIKDLTSERKHISECISAAKGCGTDYDKAFKSRNKSKQALAQMEAAQAADKVRASVEAGGGDGGGKRVTGEGGRADNAKKRRSIPQTAFDCAATVGLQVQHSADVAQRERFDQAEPFLVTCFGKASALKQGPHKKILLEFATQFQNFGKTNPFPRAQKRIVDKDFAEHVHHLLVHNIFGTVIGGPAPVAPSSELQEKIFDPTLFGIGGGLEFESSEKECASNIRLTLQGSRSVILVHGPQLIAYMLKIEPKSAALAQPNQMTRAYTFMKTMTPDMIREYVNSHNKLWFLTTGPGDALYLPAGIFFMERINASPCVLGVRVGICLPFEPSLSSLLSHLNVLKKDAKLMEAITLLRTKLHRHHQLPPWGMFKMFPLK